MAFVIGIAIASATAPHSKLGQVLAVLVGVVLFAAWLRAPLRLWEGFRYDRAIRAIQPRIVAHQAATRDKEEYLGQLAAIAATLQRRSPSRTRPMFATV